MQAMTTYPLKGPLDLLLGEGIGQIHGLWFIIEVRRQVPCAILFFIIIEAHLRALLILPEHHSPRSSFRASCRQSYTSRSTFGVRSAVDQIHCNG